MEEECVVLSFTLGESTGKEKVAVSEDRTHHLIQSSLRTCLVETREARDHSHQTRQMTPSCKTISKLMVDVLLKLNE